jgi:hypothetical protein
MPPSIPNASSPSQFDYQSVSFTTMWNPTPGNYTRYGAVDDLLRQPDDRMVIMGSGDEIRMRFAAAGLPPLPSGWRAITCYGGWLGQRRGRQHGFLAIGAAAARSMP